MPALDPALRAKLEALTTSGHVVLFMKGSPAHPRCGFSARTVELLEQFTRTYSTVDVLEDAAVREGMKTFAQWPTFPQLWIDGELVGGCDIVEDLFQSGELKRLIGTSAAFSPSVTLTAAAVDRIKEITESETPTLRLVVDSSFEYAFDLVESVGPDDYRVGSGGVTLVLDEDSARRADGLTMDFVDDERGASLIIDNPNAPKSVRQLHVQALHRWLDEGREFYLIDVRTAPEWQLARIEGARLLDEDTAAWLDDLPKDTCLAFLCHHGVRSQRAAEHFIGHGFTKVYNVTGGIDAWSEQVDPQVPRY